MKENRITPGAAMRRGRAALTAIALLAAALGLVACGAGGKGGDVTASSPAAKQADAELLNELLSRQRGVVASYPLGMEGTVGSTRAVLRRFRAQESEHADAVVKLLRGLNKAAQAKPEAIPAGKLKDRKARLRFLYEMESATIRAELSAVGKLESQTARTTIAAAAANGAQHLTVLRRLLGAKPVDVVPSPFETGTTPAP